MKMPYTEALLEVDPEARAAAATPGCRPSPVARRTSIYAADRLPLRRPLPVRAGEVLRRGAAPGRGRHAGPLLRAAGTRSARSSRRWTRGAAGDGGRGQGADGRHRHRPPARRPTTRCCASSELRGRVPRRPAAHGARPSPASASTCCEGETLGLVGESGCGKSTHRAGDPPAAQAHRRCAVPLRGPRPHRRCATASVARRPAPDADGLPGPDLVAQPAAARSATSSPSRCGSGAAATRRRAGQGRRGARGRRPRPRRRRAQAPPPVLRRPVPAHLHRPGPRARPEAASSATSRCRPSTCRCRPRSSTCSRT